MQCTVNSNNTLNHLKPIYRKTNVKKYDIFPSGYFPFHLYENNDNR